MSVSNEAPWRAHYCWTSTLVLVLVRKPNRTDVDHCKTVTTLVYSIILASSLSIILIHTQQGCPAYCTEQPGHIPSLVHLKFTIKYMTSNKIRPELDQEPYPEQNVEGCSSA